MEMLLAWFPGLCGTAQSCSAAPTDHKEFWMEFSEDERQKALDAAVERFELHPDYPRAQVRMRGQLR